MARPRHSSRQRHRLTVRLLDEIKAAARNGLKDPQIYRLVNVPRQRWHEWLNDPDSPSASTLARSRAQMAGDLLEQIATCPPGWQRLAWLLCQHFPSDYTRPGQQMCVGTRCVPRVLLTSVYRDDVSEAKT